MYKLNVFSINLAKLDFFNKSISEFRPAGWYKENKKRLKKDRSGKVEMDSDIDSNDENPFHEIIEPEKNESKPKESKRSIKRREQREARKLKMKEGIFQIIHFYNAFFDNV